MSLFGSIERIAGSLGPAAFSFFGQREAASNALQLQIAQQNAATAIAQSNAASNTSLNRTILIAGAFVLIAIVLTKASRK